MRTILTLTVRGRSSYVIVRPRDPIPAERHAANELQSFLQRISGARLPILDDGAPLSGPAILLGRTSHLDRLNLASAPDEQGPEGFVLCARGPHLVIAGGCPRGTLYGVYTFLEEQLGCRWFTPQLSCIPRRPTIRLAPFNIRQAPAMEYREPFWFEAFDADWCARNKVNSSSARLDERRGGKTVYAGFVHTFFSLLPPDLHFKRHPEYFSLINKRRVRTGQLCLTNPAVLRIVIESVKALLRRTPEATIVSVSQNDGAGACECAQCRRVEAEEGGTPAGPIIRFVNAVAEAIEPEFPDVAVDTLAYFYSRRPVTRTRPRHNVIVRLCTIECCFAHPLVSEDASFRHDTEGWSRMCRRMYVWNYATDFSNYLVPLLNLETIQPNIKFFFEHGVRGVFEQGAYQSTGGELAGLKAFLQAKALWNPRADLNRHRREFMAACYGAAAPFIERYLGLLYSHARRTGFHEQIYTDPVAGHMPPALLERAQRIFDGAERAVARESAMLHRVRVARLGVQYALLWRHDSAGPWRIRGSRYAPVKPARLADTARRFFAVCARERVTHLNERGLHPKVFRRTVTDRLRGVQLVTLVNSSLRLRVAPALGGRIVAVERAGSTVNLLALPSESERNFPSAGGYAEQVGFPESAPGDSAAFKIVGRPTRRTATLAFKFPNGLQLTRAIRLHPKNPVWTIRSVLTNAGERSQPACLRAKLCLAADDDAFLLETGGRTMTLGADKIARAVRVGIPLSRQQRPEWKLARPDGMFIACRARGSVSRALFMRQPDNSSLSVHLLTPQKNLEPRQRLVLRAAYSIGPAVTRSASVGRSKPAASDIWCDEFRLHGNSRRAAVVEDSSAPDGYAVRIHGGKEEAPTWNFDPAGLGMALRWDFDTNRFPAGPTYEVSVVLRAEISGRRGPVCAFGVYDHFRQRDICRGALTAAQASAGWLTVRIGSFRPRGNIQYVWIAPAGKPGGVPALFVNRIRVRRIGR